MNTKAKTKILVLGSGLVSRPGVRYLLAQKHLQVHVASNQPEIAAELVNGFAYGTSQYLDVMDTEFLTRLIEANDIIVSLLPWVLHVQVAKLCLHVGRHMATTSYVSEEMRHLDEGARQKGLLFLNEMGVDPGMDHMSAMKIIDEVAAEGGKVRHFYSICGGLPAPQDNDNPFGYKFSWSPKGVVLASRNSAKFLENGQIVDIPGQDLFVRYRIEEVPPLGTFEVYANRNSLPYKDFYGLKDAATIMRGTYRYPGWCDTLKKIVDLGLVDDTPVAHLKGSTYSQMMAELVGATKGDDIEAKTAAKIGQVKGSPVMLRLRWLGLFSDEPLPDFDNHLDILSQRMQEKMCYQKGEVDMLLLRHKFIVENKDKTTDMITSTLVDYGIPYGDSSMARTVSLPLAIGVSAMAAGKIPLTGVQIPTTKVIYEPVLKELAQLNIKMAEVRVRLQS